MAKKTIKAQMKQRRDTQANWASTNPVLLDGELGIVSDDPNLYKVGDGTTAWNILPFRGFDGTLAQELGTSPNAVISQKVVSEKLTELSARIMNVGGGEITYDSSILTTGYYIDSTNGSVVANYYRSASNWIEVTEGSSLEFLCYGTMDNQGYAFYNKDKQYISGGFVNVGSIKKINTIAPEGAAYIRVSFVESTNANFSQFYIKIGIDGQIEEVNKMLKAQENEIAKISKDVVNSSLLLESFYYEEGYINSAGVLEDNEKFLRSYYIPVKNGDIVTANIYRVRKYDKDWKYIGEGLTTSNGNLSVDYEVTDENCTYIRLVRYKEQSSSISLNGKNLIPNLIGKALGSDGIYKRYPFKGFNIAEERATMQDAKALNRAVQINNILNGAIVGLWIKNPQEGVTYAIPTLRYRQLSADWNNTEYTQLNIAKRTSGGTTSVISIINDYTSESIKDGEIQVFDTADLRLIMDWGKVQKGMGVSQNWNPYLLLDDVVFNKYNTIYLATIGQGISGGGSSEGANLSSNPYIAMPIPQLAMVNLVAGSLPTTKTDDILATLEFNDMQGNVFVKKIIMNAQGTSSLGLRKKNISIDIMDENYEDSHEIKFGDWVAQDGFHLKAYMLDGVRVKPMAVYDFYESMLLTRGIRKDRAWKRLQLSADISMTSNDIEDSYLQIDDGAKNHPSGFPIILYFNGVFHGIYCWQLKKHRANYHQKKSKAEHIHLDGNISNILLWEANGVINWNKWAGKEMESDSIQNKDGIEVRNPKKLILTDGTEYDADTNAGELISEDSVGFDAANADMVRTAAVRANIESLSRRVYALTQMAKGAEKKSAIAEVFDVDSIIDYIIFSQITGNLDGYKKNWQWVTYDGVKWAVNAYDLDGSWGWSSWYYYAPYTTWIHNDTPPVTLIIENYLDEIKARYKELRDSGVIDLAKIMQPLVNYIKVIGIDYYDMEYEKWTDGARDNLWRFESWMEESIKSTDALMGYNVG